MVRGMAREGRTRVTRITQTRIGPKIGNCLATCYCCIMDRPDLLEELSDAIQPAHGADEQQLFAARFLRQHGWTVLTLINFDDGEISIATEQVQGLTRVAAGMGPRGLGHAIVQLPDGSYWDPHPSRDGIAGHMSHYDVLVRL